LTINHLPDEVLLEIFDSYRQSIDPYDHQWRKNHVWLNLAHVSRKWRAIVFASSFRLDLGITVGPENPDHIKTVLSSPLPIFIDYKKVYGYITGSARWRMRAALRHHDRVREIVFEGSRANFDGFFKETKCAFPMLESLVLRFEYGHVRQYIKLPDAFLGPDPSDPHLRRLSLERVSLASISGFLLSSTALTDLFLDVDTAFGPLPEMSLLACLKGMACLRSLGLSISSSPLDSSPPKDIVPLSNLTRFRYNGHCIFLSALAGLSGPSLRDVDIQFLGEICPIVHLPRFVNEIEEHYHAVHVTFGSWASHLSLLTQSEYTSHCKPRFNLGSLSGHLDSMMGMSGALSARLTTVEELCVTFNRTDDRVHLLSWRRFFQQFPRIRALRIEDADDSCIGRILIQHREEPGEDIAFLPALEEIVFGEDLHKTQTRSQSAALFAHECRMAIIQPLISAREQIGRPVKVSFSP
jgi:hypothetical protein